MAEDKHLLGSAVLTSIASRLLLAMVADAHICRELTRTVSLVSGRGFRPHRVQLATRSCATDLWRSRLFISFACAAFR